MRKAHSPEFAVFHFYTCRAACCSQSAVPAGQSQFVKSRLLKASLQDCISYYCTNTSDLSDCNPKETVWTEI